MPVTSTELRDLLQEALGSGLRINRELRGGAMSRIFVADDVALGREIVVKVLSPELTAAVNAERFRAEVHRSARLQHPHIVPVLSTGVFQLPGGGELPYYTMPFIKGESLRDRLDRVGPLDVDDAVRILRDVAGALALAHEEGLVHRDIKPANILLTGSFALVSDFGVSKALNRAERATGLTGTGMTIGTPGYMAPEQAAADPGLDHRADLYSLGVVAYEMLTGRLPFAGDSYHEILSSQFREEMRPISASRAGLPAPLVAVVNRCLARHPGDRFQTAEELALALEGLRTQSLPAWPASGIGARLTRRWIGVGAVLILALAAGALFLSRDRAQAAAAALAARHEPTVTVVPPTLFGAETQGRLADLSIRLAEGAGRDLTKVEGLTVRAHLSVLALLARAPSLTVKEVGESLGVAHLLTFIPREDGSRVHLTAELIETATEDVLWAGDYEAAVDSLDLAEIRSDVVGEVSALLLNRRPEAAPVPPEFWRPNPADRTYREAQLAMEQRTQEGLLEASRLFEETLRTDSTYAAAAAGLSTSLGLLLSWNYRPDGPAYDVAARALTMAETAIRLQPDLPRGYIARGYLTNLILGPASTVRADYRRAMDLESTDTDFASWNAILFLRENYNGLAISEAQRAVARDPEAPGRHLALSLALLQAQRYEDAEAAARRAFDLDHDLRRAQQIRAVAFLMMGMPDRCVALDTWPYQGVRAVCLEATGETRSAARLVDSLRQVVAGQIPPSPIFDDVLPAAELAAYYSWRGRVPDALRYLRAAYQASPVGVDPRILRSGLFDSALREPEVATEIQRLQDGTWPEVLRRTGREAGDR